MPLAAALAIGDAKCPSQTIPATGYYTGVLAESVSECTPVFHDIVLTNVTVSRSPGRGRIEGLPEMPISGLETSNLARREDPHPRRFDVKGVLTGARQVNTSQPKFVIREEAIRKE